LERAKRLKPAPPGDDGMLALLVPADDERLQQAVGGDGRGQSVDALVRVRKVRASGGVFQRRVGFARCRGKNARFMTVALWVHAGGP
jgi:hypothetical protein